MKKLIFMLGLCLGAVNLFAQGGAKWSESGNAIGSSSFFGSTNNFPLLFKVNNIPYLNISTAGVYKFYSLTGTGNAVMLLNNNGELIRKDFTGLSTDVLLGSGTFGSISSLTGWTTSGTTTFTNNKVGIGVISPLQSLEVNGNAVFNGSVAAQQFVIGDVTSQGKNLRIASDISFDGYDPATGMRNELSVFTQPLYINSNHLYNFNTIINADNTGNVGIGTNTPGYKLEVAGTTKVNGTLTVSGDAFYSGKSHFARIAPMPGDTVIRFGDSTIIMSPANNNIYIDPASSTTSFYKGIGLGSTSAFAKGKSAVAIGSNTKADGVNSIAIGQSVQTTASNAVAIGLGTGGANFINSKANTLMVGFNSTIPSFYVGNSAGPGTIGKIGIGTSNPLGDFHLVNSGAVKTIISSSTSNDVLNWVSNAVYGFALGVDATGTGHIYQDINTPQPIMSFAFGNVGIGTSCLPFGFGYKLAVDGRIICEEIKVKLTDGSGCWPDYVFSKNYELMSLPSLEKYIYANNHLPGFKPAAELENEGVNLAETVKLQQQKIEELTLYLLELNKKIEKLEAERK